MDFLLQTKWDRLDSCSLFCYALVSGGEKGATRSKFLSYEDRMIIAQRLQENASFGAIGKELGKDRTTIAKEIKKYFYDKKSPRRSVVCFRLFWQTTGVSFQNPKEIERRETVPCKRTNVFYCHPSAPYQKGACEVNHELIWHILPKESNFDDLTQEDIYLMMDHINSYKRKKPNNRSPYEAFSFYYGEDVLKKLGCLLVAAENIILKPKLLKK